MLERFFKSQVATVSDSTYCHRITDALTAAGIKCYCFECGTALIEKELEEEGIVPYCPKCQQYRFPMYNVAVSMIVVDEETGKILLIQQYGKPSYILVAGYVNRCLLYTSPSPRDCS